MALDKAMYDAMGNYTGDDGVAEDDGSGAWPDNSTVTGLINASNVGWYQQKVTEFQNVLVNVDQMAQALETLLMCDLTDDQVVDVQARLSEFYTRRSLFKTTAEAFNMAASLVNSVGGAMPAVNIPSGLGFAPVVIPVGVAAAIAGAAVLVSWAVVWVAASNSKVKNILELLPDGPQKNAAIIAAAQAEQADKGIVGNALSGISDIVMWLAIGVGAWFIYKSVNKGK